jgi:hypothetical protein
MLSEGERKPGRRDSKDRPVDIEQGGVIHANFGPLGATGVPSV